MSSIHEDYLFIKNKQMLKFIIQSFDLKITEKELFNVLIKKYYDIFSAKNKINVIDTVEERFNINLMAMYVFILSFINEVQKKKLSDKYARYNYFYVPIDRLNNNYYEDPINYTDTERGNNYTIKMKKTNLKKIISVSYFRTELRNNRLVEYMSGLMCEISTIRKNLGSDWGVRIYIDKGNLKRNTRSKDNLVYIDLEPIPGEYEKWKNIFEKNNNKIDEGILHYKFYKILNDLDYVEIYKVELNAEFIVDEYPAGYIATNYRYHALCDKNKDIVIVKNTGWIIDDNDIVKSITWIKNFETTDKKIMYFLLPWYKPPHNLLNQPYTIIAYLFGFKSSQMNFKFSLDTILDYIKQYNIDSKNFIHRIIKNNISDRNKYGIDEIVLNDHMLLNYEAKDFFPLAHWSLQHKLLIFYVLHEKFKNNVEFKTDLQTNFDSLKTKINLLNINNKENIRIKNFNFANLNNFLFGSNENKYCCILPLYDTITNKDLVSKYYRAYLNTCYDMVTLNFITSLQNKNIHQYFIDSVRYYMQTYGESGHDADKIIFALTVTNDFTLKYVVTPDTSYDFNMFYTCEFHMDDYMYWENKIDNILYTLFIDPVNNKWVPIDNDLKIINKTMTYPLMTYIKRSYNRCALPSFSGLIGGSGKSMSLEGTMIAIDCNNGVYDMENNKLIEMHTIDKKIYNEIIPNSLLYFLGGHYKTATNSFNNDMYFHKYIKYKNKYQKYKNSILFVQ
jgi:hypothetical protein